MRIRNCWLYNEYQIGVLGTVVVALGVLFFFGTGTRCEAGLTYFPGQTRLEVKETLRVEYSLAVLAWQLPSGVLLADRMTPAGSSRFGTALQPHTPGSEWFLVRTGGIGFHSCAFSLTDYGWVHISDDIFVVLEVAPEKLNQFAACSLKKLRIPQGPPPLGSERYSQGLRNYLNQPGVVSKKPAHQGLIEVFLESGDQALLEHVIQEISGFISFTYEGNPHTVHTRYYSSSDKTLVASYLGDKLSKYGYEVQYETFSVGNVTCRNVVATLTGTTFPDEYVVVGGHYDSISEQAMTLAPGADDNGSGAALVMEIARMAAHCAFERSIQFVLFDSEEQGLNGSYYFVEQAVGSGRTIVSAIIADMVSYYDNNYGVIIEGEPEWETLMSIMAESTATYTTLTSRKDYYSWGSDHVPFQQAGIPAFLAIEWDYEDYPYYHTSQDNWEHIASTSVIAFEISQACAATLAEVAGLQSIDVPALSNAGLSVLILILSGLLYLTHFCTNHFVGRKRKKGVYVQESDRNIHVHTFVSL
ncbi:Zn-dependent exopeptidase M28 [bacterium]|nr:Zn-dependent exopeptidase M28 [bacterium]